MSFQEHPRNMNIYTPCTSLSQGCIRTDPWVVPDIGLDRIFTLSRTNMELFKIQFVWYTLVSFDWGRRPLWSELDDQIDKSELNFQFQGFSKDLLDFTMLFGEGPDVPSITRFNAPY